MKSLAVLLTFSNSGFLTNCKASALDINDFIRYLVPLPKKGVYPVNSWKVMAPRDQMSTFS